MYKIIMTLVFALSPGLYALAGYNTPGSTTGQFLAVGLSARSAALGESVVANVSDISSIYHNPGAMVNIAHWGAMFTHTRYPADVELAFLSVGHHITQNQVVGAAITSLYTDEMIVRTPLQPEGTGETFYTVNYAATLGFSSYLTDRFSFGANVKFIHLGYWSGQFEANSWGVDVGALFRTGLRGFNIGVAIDNLGPVVGLIKESYSIPTSFVAGVSANIVELENQSLSIMSSWSKPMSGEEKASLGLEYGLNEFAFGRVGYKFKHDTESWSFGIGVQRRIAGVKIKADYSYSDSEFLRSIQRFSIGLGF